MVRVGYDVGGLPLVAVPDGGAAPLMYTLPLPDCQIVPNFGPAPPQNCFITASMPAGWFDPAGETLQQTQGGGFPLWYVNEWALRWATHESSGVRVCAPAPGAPGAGQGGLACAVGQAPGQAGASAVDSDAAESDFSKTSESDADVAALLLKTIPPRNQSLTLAALITESDGSDSAENNDVSHDSDD
jgi:hypothetical protein